MADNYLITGYWGEPHVTAENDRGINAAMFGTGRFVLSVGEQFNAEYIGNNTIRMYDGKLMDNGAAAGIPVGEYVDLLIANAGQGMNRNDIIVFQYKQDASTLIESGTFVVIQGEETSGTASDPALTQEDLLSGEASFDQMALWRVPVSGTTISAPVKLFSVSKSIKNAGVSVVEATSNDGIAYSATVPGVTELYAGLEVTIIPKVASASTAITLDINGLGAKFVRLPLSTNTAILAQPDNESYFVDARPVRLMYDPKYANKGSWVVVGRQIYSGNNLYGTVPIEKGGTGADNAEEARENLGAAPSGYGLGAYGQNLPAVLDVDSATLIGWYYVNADSANNPISIGGVLRVESANGNNILQTLTSATYSAKYGVKLQRVCVQGTWGEWEWITPPMVTGVEYRTTEQYLGKAVYTKVVEFGALPNKDVKSVTFCGSTATAISVVLVLSSGRVIMGGYGQDRSVSSTYGIFVSTTNFKVTVDTESDFSSLTAYAIVKYVKD